MTSLLMCCVSVCIVRVARYLELPKEIVHKLLEMYKKSSVHDLINKSNENISNMLNLW